MAGLSGRVIRGGLWMGMLRATSRLIAAGRLLILARLLTPHDFGLFGLTLLMTTPLGSLSTAGSQLALIHRREQGRRALDSAWTLGVVRAAVFTALLLLFAPAVARLFGTPEAGAMIRVMALTPLLGACMNIGLVEFRQELAFETDTLLGVASAVVEFGVSVTLALSLRNAWALVGGAVAAAAVEVAISYLRHPYRPRLRLDLGLARELIQYSRWIVGTRVIARLLGSGVPALVGKLLGLDALGVFQMAWRVAVLPITQVAQMLSPVTVAAYAKLQDSPDRLRRAYLRVFSAFGLVAIPISVGAVVYGDAIVRVAFGPRWAAIVPLLRVLVFLGLARAVRLTVEPLFNAVGRPRVMTTYAVVELGLVATLLGPLSLGLGLIGAAVAVAVGAVVSAAASLWAVMRLLRVRARELVGILGPPLLACLPFVLLRGWLPEVGGDVVRLAGPIIGSGVIYLVGILVLAWLGAYSLDVVVSTLRWWRPHRP